MPLGEAMEAHNGSKGDTMMMDTSVLPAICEECETSDAVWACDVCVMEVCDMCFDVLHRKGKRSKHPKRPRAGATVPAPGATVPVSPSGGEPERAVARRDEPSPAAAVC